MNKLLRKKNPVLLKRVFLLLLISTNSTHNFLVRQNQLESTAVSSSEYKYSKRRMFSSDPGEKLDESKTDQTKTNETKTDEPNQKLGEIKANATSEKSEELNEVQRLIKEKLDYNHNGLIMSGVDNSTIILLAKIQAREQKRSAERSLARRELFLSGRNNLDDFQSFQRNNLDHLQRNLQRNLRTSLEGSSKETLSANLRERFRENLKENLRESLRGKSTRALIEDYLSHRLLKRKVRQDARQQSSRTIIIDQPSQSLARVTFNFVGNRLVKSTPMKQSNQSGRHSVRQARLMSDGVVLDHLLLGKSFVLQKNWSSREIGVLTVSRRSKKIGAE